MARDPDDASRRSGSPEEPERRAGADGADPTRHLVDRRLGLDRRQLAAQRRKLLGDDSAETEAEAAAQSEMDRRRGPGRRRTDFTRAAEEGEMTGEQFLFLMAIDEFKRANGKTFPSWTDVLEVVRLLGYRKTAASEIQVPRAEDWREKPDAPSGVRDKTGQ